jgi:hypothetical protein
MDSEDSHSGMYGRPSEDSLSEGFDDSDAGDSDGSEDSENGDIDSDDSDSDGSKPEKGMDYDNDWDDDADGSIEGNLPYYNSDQLLPDDLVTTQDHFDRKLEDLAPDTRRTDEIRYFSSPEPNLKSIVVTYKEVIKELGDQMVRNDRLERRHIAEHGFGKRATRTYDYATGTYKMVPDNHMGEFSTFKQQSMKIVGYMAKEFERKKSAQEYRKESIAKTGVLDMT